MDALKGAVGCAVVALLAGHQLSTLDPGRRDALWQSTRAAMGLDARPPIPAPASAPLPSAPASMAFGEETIAADRFGQYRTRVEIDGALLSVLVDTGATMVALSAEDADRIGLHPLPSAFRIGVDTANGRILAAEVRLASVRLGGIELRDVPALVTSRGQLGHTLLGMSFLSRLSTVTIDRGRLILAR